MVIQHNLSALNAARQYNIVDRAKTKHTEKLSSGYRINRAADDAAGLSISEKLRRQARGLSKGVENAQDGISLCQVADGALNEVHDMMQRLEELSVQAANGTNTYEDKQAIQKEITQLLAEIDRISDTTTFNEQKVFSGELAVGTLTTPAMPTTPVIGSTKTICGDFIVQGDTSGFGFDGVVLTIKDGANIAISGTTKVNRIEVADGANANIILQNVNIDVSGQDDTAAFQIADNSTGNVTIFLDGTNTLNSGENCAGLQKNGEGGVGELTISGAGSLSAQGGKWAAGIGGGENGSGSKITITGGTVTATGHSAGVGGGLHGNGNNITITGGTVTATGKIGAGVGGGSSGGNGSNITITGGTVIAKGYSYGAGIGGGGSGNGSNITITGGTVTAYNFHSGAGIGGGWEGNGSYINITGGAVTVMGGGQAAGIGGGILGDGSNISITGGTGSATCSGAASVSVGPQKIGGGAYGSGINNTVGGSPAPADAIDRKDGTFTWNLPDAGTTPPTPPTPPSDQDPDVQFFRMPAKKWWWIHSGAEPGIGLMVEIDGMDTSLLGLSGMDVTSDRGAANGINAVKGALAYVSDLRSKIGVQQNRLEHTINNENNIVENTQAAESRIRDADVAKEMVGFSVESILAQAGVSVLSQANRDRQGVMALLQ